jgi:hypothetical protein
MKLAAIALFALACSTAMTILAFMIGRCARRLPIDGTLPRVVHSARFSPDKAGPPPRTRTRTRTTQLARRRLSTFPAAPPPCSCPAQGEATADVADITQERGPR